MLGCICGAAGGHCWLTGGRGALLCPLLLLAGALVALGLPADRALLAPLAPPRSKSSLVLFLSACLAAVLAAVTNPEKNLSLIHI